MKRTDAINQWILTKLAEVHPTHTLHPKESAALWMATCGGCHSALFVDPSFYTSFALPLVSACQKLPKNASFATPFPYPPSPIPLSSGLATKAGITVQKDDAGVYTASFEWDPVEASKAKWVFTTHDYATIEQKLYNSYTVDTVAKEIDKELLKDLKEIHDTFKVDAQTLKPLKAPSVQDWLKKPLKPLKYNSIYGDTTGAYASTMKYWVAKMKEQPAAATPLMALMQQVVTGGG